MKKGQVYEGIAIDVDFPDKAVILTEERDENSVINEYHVKVKGALPGQKVKYILQKARVGKCNGRLLEVIEKSSFETAKPACANSGICGGCSYQTLPYQAQLELKKNQVLKLLSGVVEKGSYIFDGIFPSPDIWGYRNKMEFSFGDEYKGGPLSLGLHKKGSIHDIINASGCKIVNNDYSKILDCVREYFIKRSIPHYNKNTHTGILRHLLVRRSVSTGEILVALVTASGLEDIVSVPRACSDDILPGMQVNNVSVNGQDMNETDKQEGSSNCNGCLYGLGLELQHLEIEGKITGFLHVINDGLGDVVKSDETHIIFGKDWITEEILGLKFKISVFSFFQTNTKGAELLYSCARNYILGRPAGGIAGVMDMQSVKQVTGEDAQIENNDMLEIQGRVNARKGIENNIIENMGEGTEIIIKEGNSLKDKIVFDLYSGTGTIAQIIAPVVKKVTGVEIVEEAVEAAKQNAEYNQLGNCEFIAGDVLKVLDEINEKPDFIILDPPREGVNPKALKRICEDIKVPGMVYISCKPTSLARDIAEMQKYGYRVKRVCCVDMFPQSVHVESVCLLHRKDS